MVKEAQKINLKIEDRVVRPRMHLSTEVDLVDMDILLQTSLVANNEVNVVLVIFPSSEAILTLDNKTTSSHHKTRINNTSVLAGQPLKK